MSLEINQSQPSEFLTTTEEEGVIKECLAIWNLGDQAMEKTRKRKKQIVRAYECKHDELILKRKGSKAYLPWIYTAIESAHARLCSVLIPNDEDIFALVGETSDDQPGCEYMTEYLKAVFKDLGFHTLMGDAIKQLLFGDVVIKIYWRKDETTYTVGNIQDQVDAQGNPVMDSFNKPIPGMQSQRQNEVTYNNVYGEIIDSKDFIIYPVSGDISRSTCAHRVWRHIDELMAVQEAGVYRNVDRIKQDGNANTDRSFAQQSQGESYRQGLETKEFWIHRIKVGEKVYRNMIATIVDDKYLVRFEPNPYDYGLKPFIYCGLIQDMLDEGGLQNTAHGLGDRGLEIQKMANFIVNQVFDESKIKLFGFYKYVEDGVFNPATFVSRAGGMVRVGDLNNLQPVNPNIGQLSFGIDELTWLENQFDTVTGVPKFLKGIQDLTPGKDTATAKRLAAEGADTRFRAFGRRINENLLKPFVMMSYALIRQQAQMDITVLIDIARRTQQSRVSIPNEVTGQIQEVEVPPEQLIYMLPVIPPLNKVDVNIVGFENVLEKADKAAQFERFMAGVAQLAPYDPSLLQFIKSDMALRSYARYLSVESEIIRTNEEMAALPPPMPVNEEPPPEEMNA